MARLLRKRTPPRITRRAIYLIGRTTLFSSLRAKTLLGWQPQVDIAEGIHRALDWYIVEHKK